MNIEALQIFVEVMRRGDYSSVAKDRDLAPSSISRTIASLEKQLGVRLFQRTTRSLSPTEAGKLYFKRVEPIVEELEYARLAVVDSTKKLSGTLRITASPSLGATCISPLLTEFTKLHPDLTVDLHLTDRVLDPVSENIDVAIRQGPLLDSTLVAERLMQTVYSVCASPEYLKENGKPQQPNDIANHHCLTFPLPGFKSTWKFRTKNAPHHVEQVNIKTKLTVNLGLVLKKCAIDGAGLALLSDWLIGSSFEDGELVNIFPDHQITATNFETMVWIIYPTRTYIPEKVRVFTSFLKGKLC